MDSLVFARLWVGLPSNGFPDLTPFDCVVDRDLPEALLKVVPSRGVQGWEGDLGGRYWLALNPDDESRCPSRPQVLEQILVAEYQNEADANALVQRLHDGSDRLQELKDLALAYMKLEPGTVAQLRFGHIPRSKLSEDGYRDALAKLRLARAANTPFLKAIEEELQQVSVHVKKQPNVGLVTSARPHEVEGDADDRKALLASWGVKGKNRDRRLDILRVLVKRTSRVKLRAIASNEIVASHFMQDQNDGARSEAVRRDCVAMSSVVEAGRGMGGFMLVTSMRSEVERVLPEE